MADFGLMKRRPAIAAAICLVSWLAVPIAADAGNVQLAWLLSLAGFAGWVAFNFATLAILDHVANNQPKRESE